MIVLDSIKKFKNEKIYVPFYHRGHISLKPKTEVTICHIPCDDKTGIFKCSEIIITPIPFESWKYLWRINATFIDRPGIVNLLSTILHKEDINIVNMETCSVENRNYHEIEMVIDIAKYFHVDEYNDNDIALSHLEHRIVAIMYKDLKYRNNEPVLKIRRVRGLYDAYKRYKYEKKVKGGFPLFKHVTNIDDDGYIDVPGNIVEYISSGHNINLYGEKSNEISVIMVSDTKDRILRCFFPKSSSSLLYVRISHNDEIGAIATITKEIMRDFDILWSFNRIQKQNTINHFEVVLSPTFSLEDVDAKNMQTYVRFRFENCLFSKELVRQYSVSYLYPRSPSDNMENNNFSTPEICGIYHSHKQSDLFHVKSTLEDNTEELLFNLSKKMGADNVEVPMLPWQITIKKIMKKYNMRYENKYIFLSYPFRIGFFKNKTIDMLKECLSSESYQIITGEDPIEKANYREVIIDRIKSCGGFVGIWDYASEQGKKKISPWMLWELGVAQATSLPIRLLISSKVHEEEDNRDYMEVAPEIHHMFFDNYNFETKLNKTLVAISNDIKNR